MIPFVIALSIATVILPSPPAQKIERAFLQDNENLLYTLFPRGGFIHISLPEPISFSDQISSEQAYFFFKKIFASYLTLEFFTETELASPREKSFIFKARWSFKNKKDNRLYVYRLFFFMSAKILQKEETQTQTWEITEIKAEKI